MFLRFVGTLLTIRF